MTRELGFLAFAAFASAALVAAYLYLFHAEVSVKEVGSPAAAMLIGFYLGRLWERKKANG